MEEEGEEEEGEEERARRKKLLLPINWLLAGSVAGLLPLQGSRGGTGGVERGACTDTTKPVRGVTFLFGVLFYVVPSTIHE